MVNGSPAKAKVEVDPVEDDEDVEEAMTEVEDLCYQVIDSAQAGDKEAATERLNEIEARVNATREYVNNLPE